MASSRSELTDADRKRLRDGGARGGDYGPNAVAVFGGDDGDDVTVVEYIRGKWRVTVLNEHGRSLGEETYASRAAAFNEARAYGNNILGAAEFDRMKRAGRWTDADDARYRAEAIAFRDAGKVRNPARRAIDHKFAGALFSAGHPKTALAYLRGNITKTTARELAMAKPRKRARR